MSERKKRVLAVDDDPLIRGLIVQLLSPAYDVVQAADGVDALREIQRQPPDLLLLDLRMPVMDGWQLVDRLERGRYEVPIVIVSGEAQRPWPDSQLVRARYKKGGLISDLLALCDSVLAEAPAGGGRKKRAKSGERRPRAPRR